MGGKRNEEGGVFFAGFGAFEEEEKRAVDLFVGEPADEAHLQLAAVAGFDDEVAAEDRLQRLEDFGVVVD